MSALFISDLHLSPSRPDITREFETFLAGPALAAADGLYILGDLFDYWAGDDDLSDPFNTQVVQALAQLGARVPIRFMRGNRDFLVGREFAQAARLKLLGDSVILELAGMPTLIMHGDALCTDDVEYQRFRAEVRSPAWAKTFLSMPLEERKRHIEALRAQSEAQKQIKPANIMDVNAATVEEAFRASGCERLIHGHTHRPGRHVMAVDGRACERLVLGDWYHRGSHLRCDSAKCVAVESA